MKKAVRHGNWTSKLRPSGGCAVPAGAVALVTTAIMSGPVQAVTLTTIHDFCSETSCADGEVSCSAMVLGTNGDLYGTLKGAGANGYGAAL